MNGDLPTGLITTGADASRNPMPHYGLRLRRYLSQAQCALDMKPLIKLALFMIVPGIFLVFIVCCWWLTVLNERIRHWDSDRSLHRLQRHRNHCIQAFMYFLNITYMMMSRRALSVLDCLWNPTASCRQLSISSLLLPLPPIPPLPSTSLAAARCPAHSK